MTAPKIGTLDVPAATLYYKLRGSGPPLLVLPGGDGDADAADALADELADRFTILTYDRRGLARSPVDDATVAPGIAGHAEDAHRLLASLVHEPAFVLGISIGALIGLDLLARHPEQVRLLVAHEPPATELLPEPARAEATRLQDEVEQAFRRDGIGPAMREFVAIAGVDLNDREAAVALPQPKPQRAANLAFFLTHDAPAVRLHRLDIPALHALSPRIIPAAGSASRSAVGAERCARALADLLGTELVEFPGGHSAFALRPKAFAARLAEVLAAHADAAPSVRRAREDSNL
jgi:pimeloyl-ACP methyl ester carboxylesterase